MRVWLQMQHVQLSSFEETLVHSECVKSQDDHLAASGSLFVNVIEINSDGWVSRLRLRVDELVGYFADPTSQGSKFRNTVSCFRDLVSFLRQNKFPSSKQHGDGSTNEMPRFPAISPRPHLGFFLIDLLQLKIICWENRCLILDHDQSVHQGAFGTNASPAKPSSASSALLVDVFMRNLSHCLQSSERGLKGCVFDNSWHRDVIAECAKSNVPECQLLPKETVPFEMLVLDNALHAVIGKFSRHLSMIKPIFNVLHEETVKNPSDKILRRILAFKKSLMSFEMNVLSVEQAINRFLESDQDMSNLYLSEKRDISEHEEVELLLEGYLCDLQEIQLSNRTMLAQIDETKEYINTQLNEARNRIIRLSLNIEMCMLGLTFGACLGSVFGMNLTSGLEEDPYAFHLTVFSIVTFSVSIICLLIWRCVSIMNFGQQPHHPILKNFFKYIEMAEFLKINKDPADMTKSNFNDQLMRMINKDVSPEDVDLIFLIFDDNNKGTVNKNDFNSVMKRFASNNGK